MHVCVKDHLSGQPQYFNTKGEMLDHSIFFQPEVYKLHDVVR